MQLSHHMRLQLRKSESSSSRGVPRCSKQVLGPVFFLLIVRCLQVSFLVPALVLAWMLDITSPLLLAYVEDVIVIMQRWA